MQITIEECSLPEIRKEIEAFFDFKDLSQLVRSWVTPGRSLGMGSGFDDLTREKRVYLAFEIGGKEVGIAFLTEEEALRMYPRSKEVVAPPYRVKNFKPQTGPADVAFRDATDRLLEAEFDEELSSKVTDISRALALAIGLALGYGQARFTTICREFLEYSDLDVTDRYCNNFLWVPCERWNEDSNAFEAWDFYVDFRRLSQGQAGARVN